MRPQPDLPRRPSRRERKARRGSRLAGRGRVIVAAVLATLFVLLVSLRGIASFYTDFLWFDSLGLSSVWSTVLGSKLSLTLIGAVIFMVLCAGNLAIAERIAPAFRPSNGEDDLIDRYHDLVGERSRLVRLAVALFLSMVVGVNLGSSWNEWILFTNRVNFGQKDATFNTDIGFYVFQLPFLTTAAGWLFSALILVLIVTLMAHIMNGGIRFNTQLDRVTPQVKAHISVLLGALALVQGGRYWLDRYQLTFSTRGTVDGATYTDVNVQLRVTYLLILISVFAFGLFITNIWRRGWVLPAMGVGLWMFVAVLAGVLVPAFVQRFRVEPSESSMEKLYIERNIEATKEAYGLDEVAMTDFEWKGDLDVDQLGDNVETLRNVRLWDPTIIAKSFQLEQENKGLYNITDVDVDRYMVNGRLTEVMSAARDLAPTADKDSSWENTHLAFTHGSGVVAATSNNKTSSGEPRIATDLTSLKESRVYFGQEKSGYVIVNTEVSEFIDPAVDTGDIGAYDGADGIRLGSGVGGFVRKAAFALRFGDINPMVSGNITGDSRVMVRRDVSSRVEALAPFLAFDHDPYVVVLDGKVKYVVDGYTTTRNYPNAQRADTGGLDSKSGLHGRSFNYARNSVKAVVDAYDGTVDMYIVDGDDPIIQAYDKAFPDLFTPVSEASDELVEHFRYPEDLFTVQTQMWAKYHVTSADALYNRNDEWRVPTEPGVTKVSEGTANKPVGPDGQPISSNDLYQSQYLLMKLPGDSEESFVLLRPYAPGGRGATSQNQLTSFMVARSDPGDYGKLQTFVLPAGTLPDGPNLAADGILANNLVGDLRRSQCSGKSVCDLAPPTLVPVGNSILYVQPFFVAGTDVQAPQLQKVIVSYQSDDGTKVAVGGTFREALVQIFGDNVPAGIEDTKVTTDPTDEPPDGPDGEDPGTEDPGTEDPGSADPDTEDPGGTGTVDVRIDRLIDQVVAAFEAADTALTDGDPVAYAEQIQKAKQLTAKLDALRRERDSSDESDGKSSGTTTTLPGETPTTTAPPATTTSSAGA